MLTAILIFLPLLASVLVLALKPAQARVAALIIALAELAVSLVAYTQFNPADTSAFSIATPWIAQLGINFNIGMDGTCLVLVLLATVLTPFIILSSFTGNTERPALFYFLILVMQAAMIGVFVAEDGFLFYIFWEMALIPIYFICLLWGGAQRVRVTLKFFIYTLAGSLFMLIGLIYLYLQTPGEHSFGMQALYEAGKSLDAVSQSWVFWALFVAFAIKMPVFPFHTWQPDTYFEAPAQGTMLLSGIMLKMGVFGVIRWLLPVVPQGVAQWSYVAVILSVIGVVYASFLAIVQKDIKRLIAYSSIAHVGLISAGIFTQNSAAVQGAVIQMFSHGIIVFGLFYIVEIIQTRTGTTQIDELGGIRSVAPKLATLFMVIMFGSVALPFTSGFVGEFLLLNGLFQYQPWLSAVAGLSVILGAIYMLNAYRKSTLGETNTVTQSIIDLSTVEKVVLIPLCLLIVVIGIYPAPLLDLSQTAAQNLLQIVELYK